MTCGKPRAGCTEMSPCQCLAVLQKPAKICGQDGKWSNKGFPEQDGKLSLSIQESVRVKIQKPIRFRIQNLFGSEFKSLFGSGLQNLFGSEFESLFVSQFQNLFGSEFESLFGWFRSSVFFVYSGQNWKVYSVQNSKVNIATLVLLVALAISRLKWNTLNLGTGFGAGSKTWQNVVWIIEQAAATVWRYELTRTVKMVYYSQVHITLPGHKR